MRFCRAEDCLRFSGKCPSSILLVIPLTFVLLIVSAGSAASSTGGYPSSAGAYPGEGFAEAAREYDKFVDDRDCDAQKATFFVAYVRGVWDALIVQETVQGYLGDNACPTCLSLSSFSIPEEVTLTQVLSVVSGYAKEHPEDWHKGAAVMVIGSLTEAFSE